ncbi:MAG: translation initiation factor IF-2 associated domain-containing protein, partial [Burkholderiales bacterium]
MTITTVAEFAKELKKSPDTLLEQLKSAGVAKSSSADPLTDADKQKLLGYLKASHGTDTPERKKITLVKKSTSEIKQADATGKARTIQVEVRKKRTFVKRDEADTTEADAPAQERATAAPILDQAELARREEEARRQAELIRRQEEELAEKRRVREAQEAKEREASAMADDPAATKDEDQADAKAAKAKALAEQREAAAKASAAEDAARAKDLDSRKRTALAEAEAIRSMMNAPKKVLVAKKPVVEKTETPDPK